ncbi:aconitate hydratase [Coemansia sp. RSA 2050]|nr:aconitate hydratase [Coemansia sp. RSA 2050]KAJ2737377.1 aconitate hydratase [Coemansia sp. BCRC 34962]
MSTEESKKRRWDQSEAADEHATLPTKMAATSIGPEQPESVSDALEPVNDSQVQQPCSEPLSEHEPSAYMPPPKSETSQKLGAPAAFTTDVDINDSDNRQTLAKNSTHIAVIEATGVEIATRGRRYDDASKATPADPALHLHVEAASQEMLNKVVEITETMKREDPATSLASGNDRDSADLAHLDNQPSGCQSSASGNSQRFQDKVYIEVESTRGFNVRAKVIGTGGENMKFIQNTTGARVQVRGNGSGCDENAPGSDPYEPMHLYITAASEDALSQAKGYCTSLIETLHAQYYEFKDISGRRYEPNSSHRDSRDRERDRDRYQPSRHRGDRHHYDRSQQAYYPSRQEYHSRQEYAPRQEYPPQIQHEYLQSYPQQGYSQQQHEPTPSAATSTAAYDEYAKYYAEYYQYYGAYPDQSAYYSQAEHGTTHTAYPGTGYYPQDTYLQHQPHHSVTSTTNTNSHYDKASPGNTSPRQNGYHSVPPPTDYSNNKV